MYNVTSKRVERACCGEAGGVVEILFYIYRKGFFKNCVFVKVIVKVVVNVVVKVVVGVVVQAPVMNKVDFISLALTAKVDANF